jgi:hypothetical protein
MFGNSEIFLLHIEGDFSAARAGASRDALNDRTKNGTNKVDKGSLPRM